MTAPWRRSWDAEARKEYASTTRYRTWQHVRSKHTAASRARQSMLEIGDLTKEYPTPQGPLPILSGVSLSLKRGDAAAIMGPSGAGKSTLLYIVGGLEPPTSGSVTLDGVDPHKLAEKELSAFRNRKIGFLFQDHCLLPQCSVLENVLIPCLVDKDGADYPKRARELL